MRNKGPIQGTKQEDQDEFQINFFNFFGTNFFIDNCVFLQEIEKCTNQNCKRMNIVEKFDGVELIAKV